MSGSSLRSLSAVLAILMLNSPAMAQLSGTLFTSPDERNYLNYLREEFLRRNQDSEFDFAEAEIPQIPTDEQEEAAPEYFTLSGIMTRSDGSYRVWLNDRALDEQQLPPDSEIITLGGNLALRFSSPNGTYTLKPGETLDLTSGTIIFGRPPEPEPPEQSDQADAPESASPAADTTTKVQESSAAPEQAESAMSQASEVLENLRKMPELMQTLQTMLENENAR